MNHHGAANPLTSRYPTVASNDAIEWEETPSLADRLCPMDMQPQAETPAWTDEMAFDSAWGVTLPAHLDCEPQPLRFRETIRGLATREMNEPELFKYFFG